MTIDLEKEDGPQRILFLKIFSLPPPFFAAAVAYPILTRQATNYYFIERMQQHEKKNNSHRAGLFPGSPAGCPSDRLRIHKGRYFVPHNEAPRRVILSRKRLFQGVFGFLFIQIIA